ncbi:alpha-1B adrenergic receptor-like [Paramacrobiotus metropolitanus]|uniref:alpha-1B adrenergic receptor-like n=1 Tax=Paramacrobiotus metropolitanus TaxID=2943436 RepID=UPI0024462427|nr:alpha-1B adrenergic receptor-like [Paramacrobiotus metropolitanus]
MFSSPNNLSNCSIQNTTESVNTQPAPSSTILTAILPYLLIILSLSITLCDGIVLVAFFVNRRLLTPFNFYLVSLLLSDIGQATLDLPFTIVSMLCPTYPLSRIACNFNLYAKWMFAGVVRNSHALISLNRFCALFWPLMYKQFHTPAVAIGLCVGTWGYVHLWLLPGLVPDAIGLRKNDGTCAVNTTAQPTWALTTQMCLYNSTLVVIAGTYPLIWWKMRQRNRTAVRSGVLSSSKQAHPVLNDSHKDRVHTCANGSVQVPDARKSVDKDADEFNDSLDKHTIKTLPSTETERYNGQRKRSQSFVVLTYLVVGVVFCWTPIMTFYTLADFTEYDSNIHFLIGSLLYYFNSLLDPFFYCIAIKPLRATILGMLRKR